MKTIIFLFAILIMHSYCSQIIPVENVHNLMLTELESSSYGNSVLSLIGITIENGEEGGEILNLLMKLKSHAQRSLSESKQMIKDSSNNYNISMGNYENSVTFHSNKIKEYELKLKITEDNQRNSEVTSEMERKLMEMSGQLLGILEKKRKVLTDSHENAIHQIMQDIAELNKNINTLLNNERERYTPLDSSSLLYISNADSEIKLLHFMLTNVKNNSINISNNRKEKLVNILYNYKTKLENILDRKKLEYNNEIKLIEENIKLLTDSLRVLVLPKKKNTTNALNDLIMSIKTFLKFHQESENINLNLIKNTKKWYDAEQQNMSNTNQQLITTLQAINKVKKLFIANSKLLKEYLASK